MKRIEGQKSNPHSYGQLIFDKGSMTTQWWKDSLQQMLLGKLDSYM